jgi:hypothetical protein
MLGVVEAIIPPQTFLRDMFFGRTETSRTEYVDFDKVVPTRKLAPFVRPEMEGKVVEAAGFSTKIFIPPYTKAKKKTTAGDLLKRSPGESIYSTVTPTQRAAQQLGKDLKNLQEMVIRLEEYMCSSVLRTGKVTVTGDGYSAEIDFGMHDDNTVDLTGNDRWTETTSDPVGDIEDWKDLIEKKAGLVPDVIIFGVNSWKDFIKHADTKAILDNRRVQMGEIRPQSLAKGVTYLGNWDGSDLYKYSDWYQDDNGVLQRMFPTDGVLVGCTQSDCAMHYGAIQDVDAISGEGSIIEGKYFPKSWIAPDPSARWLMMQSAPLPGFYVPDAFVFADVEASS